MLPRWMGAELISLLASQEAYVLGRWSRFVPRGTLFLGECEKGGGSCGKRPRLVLVSEPCALLLWGKALPPECLSWYGVVSGGKQISLALCSDRCRQSAS